MVEIYKWSKYKKFRLEGIKEHMKISMLMVFGKNFEEC